MIGYAFSIKFMITVKTAVYLSPKFDLLNEYL